MDECIKIQDFGEINSFDVLSKNIRNIFNYCFRRGNNNDEFEN